MRSALFPYRGTVPPFCSGGLGLYDGKTVGNTMFIFTTMLIVYLFHRRCFWRVVVSVFWLFLGIVNCILLMNRVTPFTGPDLHMLTDGIAIMQKYLPFCGDRMYFDRNCGAGAFDPTGQGTEV